MNLAAVALYVFAGGWTGLCLARALRRGDRAIEVGGSVTIAVPRQRCFAQYTHVDEYYLELSPGHVLYRPRQADRTVGALIDVHEGAGFQFVRHVYEIVAIVPNQELRLVSASTQVRLFGLIRSRSRSEATFTFADAPGNGTLVTLTLRIVFPNLLRELLARIFLTRELWMRHVKGEMRMLGHIIERREREAQAHATNLKATS